ncbi:unnamed protein product [Adineta steineri]|uniref:G-protein coupled receptors family 1 profile domain-containing protein n=1 Tax=Adineta steineri TaxID=433720 RepID=A0A814FD64_9BILA|nr:unnamed protein product [Adineta steineri]
MSAQVTNIILDLLIIGSATLAVLVSLIMILIMLIHKSTIKRDRTAHLLCINMYASLLIGCGMILIIYCYTLYGHIYINISFDGPWCYAQAYLLYVSGCGFFYSYLLQAIYRLCRIVHYTKPSLQSFRLYVYGIIIQWILSFLQVIPVLLLRTFEYLSQDYHCQIAIYNVRGLIMGLSMVHMIPISLTTICCIYTMMYIRRRSVIRKSIRQQANDRRDFLVLKRIFILLSILIASGMPTLGISLFFQISGYLPLWSTQFQWLTATFSIFTVSVILIFVSPNIPKFWKRQ